MLFALQTIAALSLSLLAQGGAGGAGGGPGSGSNETAFILWGVLLIGAAVALFIVEIFVPSGGIIGLVGAIALVGGIVLLFLDSATVGLIGAAVTLVSLPFLIGFGLKVMPDTPIGRLFVLSDGSSKAAGGGSTAGGEPGRPVGEAEAGDLTVRRGAEGRALTDMHPVGTCLIEGQREQCLASTGQIDAGQSVRVIAVDGMQIKVQPVR